MVEGYDLTGRVAIVTGGGEGIGAATAALLARYGADIVLAGRTLTTLRQTARAIADETGRQCHCVSTDMREEAQVRRLVASTLAQFGRTDILINNVGWSAHAHIAELTYEDWLDVFRLNLDSAFFASKEVLPHMRKQRRGVIVNNSSTAGLCGVAGLAAYSSAKAGLVMLTKVAAAEWGPFGIRVNAVAPGLIATENGLKEFASSGLDVDAICAARPLRRAGKPEEVARAIAFLASDASSYNHGGDHFCDGRPRNGRRRRLRMALCAS